MASIGTGYDLSAAQFSPDGRVFQVEYALKAVENSGTAVALKGKDGVVMAVEKLVTSKLFEAGTNKRIFYVDRHIGMSIAGLLSDARQLVKIARDEARSYRRDYDDPIPLKYLADRVSMYMHAYTLYSSLRPFGVCAMLCSYERGQPSMYMIDPSGVSHGFHGCAIGKAKQAAKTEIEKLKLKDMTCRELAKEAAKIIYTAHDEVKDKNFELELSWVGQVSDGKHEFVPQDVYDEANKYGKDSLVESDSEDEEMQG